MKNLTVWFILGAFLILPAFALADDDPIRLVDGEISWTAVRTELEKDAVGLMAELFPKLNTARYFVGPGGVGYLGPKIEIRSGSDDAFQSLLAKVSGFWMITPPDDEDHEPDYTRHWIHVFPFSVGIEADRDFKTPSALVEFGWTPLGPRKVIDPQAPSKSQRFGLSPNRGLGVYLQGGYRFDNIDESEDASGMSADQGGDSDESQEKPDEPIARVKAEATYAFTMMNMISLVPRGTGWYDMLNQEFYYRLEALLRFAIIPNNFSLDFLYEKGSGAPNFNEGDQYSTGLTIMF